MEKFSLTFLVITLVALFVAEFTSSQSTPPTENNNAEIEDLSSSGQFGGKICCMPTLYRDDYIVTPGVGAYKFHKRRMSWNDARLVCLMEGAQLAVLDSARKLALFKDWMKKESRQRLWLGFHDLFREGSWTTVTGEMVDTMSYEPWAKDQPNNWNNEEHCGFLWEYKKEGIGLHDEKCSCNYSFICEINLCTYQNPLTVPNAESMAKLS